MNKENIVSPIRAARELVMGLTDNTSVTKEDLLYST